MLIVETTLGVLLTGLTLRFGKLMWLRRIAVGYLVLALILGAGFGLTNVARFGMIDNLSLLRSKVVYADAYRAGLLAAQEVANRYTPIFLILFLCLAVLAWFPVKRD